MVAVIELLIRDVNINIYESLPGCGLTDSRQLNF